jgi:hypothetical protein
MPIGDHNGANRAPAFAGELGPGVRRDERF